MTDQDNDERRGRKKAASYLDWWPGMVMRRGDSLVDAPDADQKVAKGYAAWQDKGPVTMGLRLTIMAASTRYRVGEEVRVVHVLDAPQTAHEVYIMGPKPVFGEFLDGRLVTDPPPEVDDPWIPTDYDGATLPSPAVDYNYDVTSYRFDKPGVHRFQWRLGVLASNVLTITIAD